MNGDFFHAKPVFFPQKQAGCDVFVSSQRISFGPLESFFVLNWLRQAWLALSGSKRCNEIVQFSQN